MEAAEHLATALESPNDPAIVKYRQMLADALDDGPLADRRARHRAAARAGAEVVVNGHVVGALPLASPIKLAAREHARSSSARPAMPSSRELVPIAGGQRHALTVNLVKIERSAEPAPTVVPAASPPPEPPQAAPGRPPPRWSKRTRRRRPSTGSRTAAWIFGGGAVVAVGAGLALQLAARSNVSDFNGSCKNDPTHGIVVHDPAPLTLQQCRDRYDALSYRVAGASSATSPAPPSRSRRRCCF